MLAWSGLNEGELWWGMFGSVSTWSAANKVIQVWPLVDRWPLKRCMVVRVGSNECAWIGELVGFWSDPATALGARVGASDLSSPWTWAWSFIPPRQYNLFPDTKYLSPALVNGTVVFPFPWVAKTLVVLHVLKFSFVTSSTLWPDEYWKTERKKNKFSKICC